MTCASNLSTKAWGELMKLDIPIDLMEQCHVFFVFRNRVARDKGQNSNATLEKPFAFAFLPLFPDGRAFIADGSHTLALYKSDRNLPDAHVYLQLPSVSIAGGAPNIPLALSKTVVPLRDTMVIRTFLCSTRYTQNEVLLKLLRWETLPADPNDLKDTLNKLRFCSEIECCKFLRDIFQALFGILGSARNRQGELDDVIFNALVTLLGIISDRRFTLFKPVVDLYIDQHFNSSTASSHIIKSFQKLLASPASVESGQTLRSAIKVWHYLFKIIVRSREIQRNKDVGLGVT
jgi:dedicator of cytokinesis protein 3